MTTPLDRRAASRIVCAIVDDLVSRPILRWGWLLLPPDLQSRAIAAWTGIVERQGAAAATERAPDSALSPPHSEE